MPPESRFRTREIALSGRLRTADDPATIAPNDLAIARNVRPSDQYWRGVQGMTKINTSALASTGIRNGFHFRKAQPAESHLMAWTSDGKVWKNDTAIPSQGAFSSVLFTDTAGGSTGRFANGPDGALVYANGVDTCAWGGTEHRCAGFIDFPAAAKVYNYSDKITNTLTTPTISLPSTPRLRAVRMSPQRTSVPYCRWTPSNCTCPRSTPYLPQPWK